MNRIARFRDAIRSIWPVWPVWVCTLGCLIFLIEGAAVAMGATGATGTTRAAFIAGIWYDREKDHRLSSLHEEQLVRSLRRITGMEDLCFTEDGALSFGDISGGTAGSSIARQILWCALGAGKVFIIEDHSNSPAVNFGQLDEGTNYEDILSGKQFDIWRVRLDFEDFNGMAASSEVRASFDAGITLLHELLHGLGYKDTSNMKEIGDCEELINQVRAELGLPLRDRYFGEPLEMVPHLVTVRLRFRSEIKLRGPMGTDRPVRRWHYLYFLLPSNGTAAQPQKGVIMPGSAP